MKSLHKPLIVAATLMAAACAAQANTDVFGSYLTVDGDVYTAQNAGGSAAPTFGGANLGSFLLGSSAFIDTVQLLTWKDGGSNVTGARFNFRIDGGAFTEVTLAFGSDSPSDLGGTSRDENQNQSWGAPGAFAPINFLSGVGAGNHTLEVFFYSTTSDGDRFSANGGNNFIADFSVAAPTAPVPEPTSMLMLAAGLGAVSLAARRRRRS